MENNEEKFKDIFRQNFDDFEVEPNPLLREKILEKQNEKRRGIIIWWSFASKIAASILIGFLVWNLVSKNIEITEKTIKNEVSKPKIVEKKNNNKTIVLEKNLPFFMEKRIVKTDLKTKKVINIFDSETSFSTIQDEKNISTFSEEIVLKKNFNQIISKLQNIDYQVFTNKKTLKIEFKNSENTKNLAQVKSKLTKLSYGFYPILGYRSVLPNRGDIYFVSAMKQQNPFQRLGLKTEANFLLYENKDFDIKANAQAGVFRQFFDFTLLNVKDAKQELIKEENVEFYKTIFPTQQLKEDYWSGFVSAGSTISWKIAKKRNHKIFLTGRVFGVNSAKKISFSPVFDVGYNFTYPTKNFTLTCQPQFSYVVNSMKIPSDYFSVKNYQVGIGILFTPKS